MATPPASSPGVASATHTTPGQQGGADSYRLAVAQQTSVESSVMALLQAVCSAIGEALDKADPASLKAFSDSISQDPKSWCDAVVANTPDAVQSAARFVSLSGAVQEAFNKYAMQAKEKAAAPAQHDAPHGQQQAQGAAGHA